MLPAVLACWVVAAVRANDESIALTGRTESAAAAEVLVNKKKTSWALEPGTVRLTVTARVRFKLAKGPNAQYRLFSFEVQELTD
jgi:hypothetical protein